MKKVVIRTSEEYLQGIKEQEERTRKHEERLREAEICPECGNIASSTPLTCSCFVSEVVRGLYGRYVCDCGCIWDVDEPTTDSKRMTINKPQPRTVNGSSWYKLFK